VSSRVVVLSGEASRIARTVIVRDPDGHALQFIQAANALAEK